ncbi:MAG: 30S ribosomal protein S6 [Patescibacteria group bacterium]
MENELKQYELTCILEPHLDGDSLDDFKKDLEKTIIDNKGKLVRLLEPEKRELSYPINKQGIAIYIVAQISFESGDVNEFLKELRANKLIVRHLITAMEIPKADSDKPRVPKKPRVKKEETIDKPSFTKVSEGKKDNFNLEEIDKKLDELVGL